MSQHVLAIDQGTTSSRAIIFDRKGSIVASAQREHRQILPHAGWVEHDPKEIWNNVQTALDRALSDAGLSLNNIAGIGLTNQRATTVVWNKRTGEPIYNAIVWQDTRTQPFVEQLSGSPLAEAIQQRTALPFATHLAGPKITWILQNVAGARKSAEAGDLLFGTIDTWLLWNLTGGPHGGIHATDATNANRTGFMDISTCSWIPEALAAYEIPATMMPEIRSSSEIYGYATALDNSRVPVSGILGDQQAAAFGQASFNAGESKNTYGTGNFLLINTGKNIVRSNHGLLTTLAYQVAGEPAHYALEGSIAITGSLVQWLRDNLGVIQSAADIEALAASVADNGGVYIVPAFSGLYAPYWRPSARGLIIGLTGYANKAHLARAALESIAFQTAEVIEAANADFGSPITELRVDGGIVANGSLMQFQADILGVPVVRPEVTQTTALGAAYAAGLAVGVWSDLDEIATNWREDVRWLPHMTPSQRTTQMSLWRLAVARSFDWADHVAEISADQVLAPSPFGADSPLVT